LLPQTSFKVCFRPNRFFSEEIEMKNVIGSLVAVAGLAVAANAQSRLDLQVSTDGVNWSNSAEISLAGSATGTVLMRALISWTGDVGPTAGPVGFASLTWQPVFGNVRPGVDSVQPFANQGNNTNGGSVILDGTPLDGPFGRVSPWGSTGPSGTASYQAIAHSGGSGGAPPGNFLRIARNDVTRWMGTGPTSGATAVNNFNGAGGVACVQKAVPTPGVDPDRVDSLTNNVIWQIALTVGGVAQGASHDISVQAPTDGMSRNTVTGNREASWFRGPGDNAGAVKGTVAVNDAVIHITPAPGALALLGLGGLVAGRRRRA
jgi:hypothetical protein